MIFDHSLISQRYFFPRAGALAQTRWVETNGVRLACYHEAPHSDAKTLIHFHGNGEIVPDYVSDFTSALVDLGVNIFFAEYRGYGSSTGTPALVSMFDDLPAILEATQCPPQDCIIFGRSIGSIYAIECAKQFPQIAALVLESGIADPTERLLMRVTPEELGVTKEAFEAEARLHLNHQEKLAAYRGRLLVLHTENDGLVERSHADRNFAWAGSAPDDKTLRIFPRGNHNSIMAVNWSAYLEELRQLIQSL